LLDLGVLESKPLKNRLASSQEFYFSENQKNKTLFSTSAIGTYGTNGSKTTNEVTMGTIESN
jgi:NAD dependent epimerase/dehydratase family enzyme